MLRGEAVMPRTGEMTDDELIQFVAEKLNVNIIRNGSIRHPGWFLLTNDPIPFKTPTKFLPLASFDVMGEGMKAAALIGLNTNFDGPTGQTNGGAVTLEINGLSCSSRIASIAEYPKMFWTAWYKFDCFTKKQIEEIE